MIQIGAFAAKTHFAEILRRVAEGEEFCVTNRGKTVAIITSPDSVHDQRTKSAFAKLRVLRKKHPLGTVSEICDWKTKERT